MSELIKYSKVELIVSGDHPTNLDLIQHNNCNIKFTGNYMIINEADEGIVYDLKSVKRYKIYKKKEK